MQPHHPSRRHAAPKHKDRTCARALRALVAGITAATFVLGGLPTQVLAQDPPVNVDQEALGDMLFATLLRTRDGGTPGLEHMLLSAELLEWRRQNPTATPQQVTDHVAARRQTLTNALTLRDRALPEPEFAIRVVTVLLSAPPSTVATSPHIRSFLDATLGRSVAAFDTREDLATGALHTAQWLRGKDDEEAGIWSAVRRRAVADDGFAQAWNTVIGAAVNLDARAPLDQLKNDPTLNTFINVSAILAKTGSQSAFLDELKSQFAQVVARLLQEAQEARARATQLTIVCPLDPKATTCTIEKRTEAKEVAEQKQKDIDGAAAGAKLLGALIGLTDQKRGEKFEKVATAVYSVVTAINKYGEAIAGLEAAEAILSGATLVMTGNILGAVVTLAGLFDNSPSLDQQILEQVGKLREEVRALRDDMRQSFQRIEAKLNTIFDAMMTEFAKLDAAVAGNTAALIEIQNRLAEQSLRLEQVAAAILTAIGQDELHDARFDVDQYIGYLENFGEAIPTYDQFKMPETEFHLVATDLSTDAAFVVSPAEANNPAVQKADVLNERGESASINYLARLAHARDARVPDPTVLVANSGVWNFGAQAYALLQLQNPGYATQVGSFRSAQIANEGQRILDLARTFSQPAPAPDQNGNRTNAVFKGLVQEYGGAVDRLSTEMARFRTNEILARKEIGNTVGKQYDLFGPVDQATPASGLPAEPSSVGLCSPGAEDPHIQRPSNVSFASLAPEFRFAVYAYSPMLDPTDALPKVQHCYDVTWVNVRRVTTTFAKDTFARLRVTMHTQFRWSPNDPSGWRNARNAVVTFDESHIARECRRWTCTDDFSITVFDDLRDQWPIGHIEFEQGATITGNPALLTEAQIAMAAFLQGRQRALYAKLGQAIQNAASPVHAAVNDMNNAARQLQAYTRLGFPIALEADDLLSSLLFGDHSIPVNMIGTPQLDYTYGLAAGNYTCNPATDASSGTLCFGGPFHPLRDQPLLDTVGGADLTPVVCGVSTTGSSGLPGDQLGDCLIASTRQRVDALAARYRQHSQFLADGVYVEQIPWIASTLSVLPVVNTLVHTPLPPPN